MRIGFVVDGDAEYRSLPILIAKILSPHVLLKPIIADLQPSAPPGQIARTVKSRLPILEQKRVDRVVVLIDRENTTCPGDWATEIEDCMRRLYPLGGHIQSIYVVSKVACFENWLISDVEAFQSLPKRFRPDAGRLQEIALNRADHVNAQSLLKRWAVNQPYDKVEDAQRILNFAEPHRMAAASRSFRRFLRAVGSPKYQLQSRNP